ncbi:MAG: lysophospholipid acyltransferase family protein [Amphritea sp.]
MKHLKGPVAISVLFLISLLPLKWAQGIGAALGRRLWKGTGKAAVFTKKNVELCFPNLSDNERSELALQSLVETGRSAGEMGMSWMWSPERVLRKVRNVHGEDVLQEAMAEGRGVILIAPHLGNWEVLNLYLSKFYPLTAMYKPPKIKMMDDLIRKKRERIGSKLAPANIKGVRMAMKALKAGEMLGILPDQEPDDKGGVFAPFFGVEAFSMKLLPQLAAQTKAVVVSGYAKRLPGGEGFDLYFHRAEGDIANKEIRLAATEMNREVEFCVRQIPEQYQWEYGRFNTRPDNETSLYRP